LLSKRLTGEGYRAFQYQFYSGLEKLFSMWHFARKVLKTK
jgi:hypothetical protein